MLQSRVNVDFYLDWEVTLLGGGRFACGSPTLKIAGIGATTEEASEIGRRMILEAVTQLQEDGRLDEVLGALGFAFDDERDVWVHEGETIRFSAAPPLQ